MVFFDLFKNYFNALIGKNQEFEQLLSAKDVSAIKNFMSDKEQQARDALTEYTTESHKIMERKDKLVTDKTGAVVRVEPVWKLAIPYPVYINEISLVFLYGRPVKWMQSSKGTDNAFEAFKDVIKRTRFNSKIRQCKRIAGSETQSAMLFRVFRDNENKPDVQIRVLAHSKGDEIYVRWDEYENILSIAWGHYIREGNENVYLFDIYTPNVIYHCKRRNLGWDVEEEPNFVGKIPIILFQQDKEWAGVEGLIHREEYIGSTTADTNDYFSDPIAIVNADVVKNMPNKGDMGKLLISNAKDGVNNVATYLTWDQAPESKKQEIEWLQDHILSKTFTPKISLDSLKSISQLSAKAIKTVMMLADIKASKHKEVHDELLDRTASLITAIVGNVLNVSLAAECKNLVVEHEFQEPFGEDVAEALDNIIKSVEAGILSTEGGVEMNPIIKDNRLEMQRLKEEQEERKAAQAGMFNDTEGAGPQPAAEEDEE